MTDRKPALKRQRTLLDTATGKARCFGDDSGPFVFASDIPPAILNATKEELGAAVLAIEQFRETQARATKAAALAAAKEADRE